MQFAHLQTILVTLHDRLLYMDEGLNGEYQRVLEPHCLLTPDHMYLPQFAGRFLFR